MADNRPGTCFCTHCGQRLPVGPAFCPYCGGAFPGPPPEAWFYVFAVRGPSLGAAGGGDIVLEKATALKNGCAPARGLGMRLVRPSMWDARVKAVGGGGVTAVSYSMDGFADDIRRYLRDDGFPDARIDAALALSASEGLQLSNPYSGVFVMGVPLLFAEAPAPEPEPELAECAHEYRHFACVKCGAPAPRPALPPLGTVRRQPYTYEYYRAESPDEALCFLGQTEVTEPNAYVVVETPDGRWGRDKDGVYLEALRPWQRDLSPAVCSAHTAAFPARPADLRLCAEGVTDNYLLEVACGRCGHRWTDGVAYRAKTAVRCPECGAYNIADTNGVAEQDPERRG